jgi:hypothetical protein
VPAAIDEAALLGDLRTLVQSARQRIATAAYSTQTLLCWHMGRRLDREHLQGGRAAYGKQILVTVSRELTAEYGRGFSYAEIARMIQFAQAYPEEAIVVTLSQQLSWSHFHALLPIKDPLARDFYAETDPNKLHDLKAALDGAQVYSPDQVQQFAALFLAGAERDQLDPILDACVAAYTGTLDEDQQVDFKGKAKVFCRTYDFLASVMPGTNPEWEKLSILLNLLVSKLPAPEEEDLAKGILEAIDMDSYRVEKKALMKIALADADAEIAPVPTDGGGRKPEPELDRLEQHPQDLQRQLRHVVRRHRPRGQAHQGRHRAQGGCRQGLPERPGQHASHRTHGPRPGTGQSDADPAEGRHAGLQAVRRERVVSAVCGGHGLPADEPVAVGSGKRRSPLSFREVMSTPVRLGSRCRHNVAAPHVCPSRSNRT